MQIGIEFFALLRLEFLHPMLLQHLQQFALGQFDAVKQSLDAGIRLVLELGAQRLQGAVHVVGNRQNVARE